MLLLQENDDRPVVIRARLGGGCGASAAHLTFNGHGDVATAMVGPINEDAQDDKGRCSCMALSRDVRYAATKQTGRESL